uniref:GCN5-like N-acetyltransferase n=1 Tax=Rhodogorgon sp. TaxID=2485824 RepID=A0A3G3MIA6_9FLOR|nr:GCN5-like N-acetyltransferase [Rhodogorgon sp.]
MTFWKLFLNNTKTKEQPKKSKTYKNIQDILLIKHLDNKNKIVDIYLSKDKNINLYDLEELCDAVGWVRRPLRKVKTAIEHSFLTISLFYQQNNTRKLIAFARATSDNAFNATIWDVVVHPEYQGKGLGKTLIKQIVQQLRYYDINTITLFADPEVINFYKGLGFTADPDGVKGMFWYPR